MIHQTAEYLVNFIRRTSDPTVQLSSRECNINLYLNDLTFINKLMVSGHETTLEKISEIYNLNIKHDITHQYNS